MTRTFPPRAAPPHGGKRPGKRGALNEPLGSDVILYLTVGSHSIVARVDAHTQARMGQSIEVVLDMRKMHLFDPQTQQAIL